MRLITKFTEISLVKFKILKNNYIFGLLLIIIIIYSINFFPASRFLFLIQKFEVNAKLLGDVITSVVTVLLGSHLSYFSLNYLVSLVMCNHLNPFEVLYCI